MTKNEQKIQKLEQEMEMLQQKLEKTPERKQWWIRLLIEVLRVALAALGINIIN